MKKLRCAVLFFVFIMFSMHGADGSVRKKATDSVLASVNGEPVSLSDIMFETQNEEYYFANSLDQQKASKAIYDLRKKTLEELIDRKLILMEYKKKPFPIDNQQISNVLDDMAVKANCRTRSEFYEKIRASGLSVDDFRRRVEERITVQYVIGRELYVKVNISPKAVYEYYKNNENEFSTPDSVRMSILFLNSANKDFESRKKAVADALNANPSDFYSLVSEYSELTGLKKNNFVLQTPLQSLRSEFKAVFNEKKLNQIIGPLEISGEGVYYLMADRIIPGRKKNLAEVQQQIIRKLEEKQREKAYAEYVKKLRSNAIIRYMF
ncbi:MAG: SurA N-terminal domain-containing protein [Lentisphaeria bacterium]|nr:SurA N-terminal domain-containing protein [Lentisphaeria bacterium]